MENQEKRELFSKIEELRSKRQKHEKVISKLLSNQESTYRTPFSTSFSQNNQIVEEQFTNRSTTTNLSEQVNLEAHLLEAEWADKNQTILFERNGEGKTNWISMEAAKKFGDAECEVGIDGVEGIIVGMDVGDLGVIAEYLTSTSMWEEIFIFKDGHYFANLFPNFSPANKNTLLLSATELEECEISLLILCSNGSVSLGYLLLHRLMSYLNSGSADHIFQSLFGYPFFRYSLHNTSSFLNFSERLQSLSNNTLLLAKSSVNNRISILDLKGTQEMEPKQLLENYSEISVCYEIENLFSVGVRIRHKRNHHAVIEIENGGEEEIELFVSFVANAEVKGQEFYRYCLIDEEGELVGYSEPTQHERENFEMRVPPKSTYKMYVAEMSRSNSSDLSTFEVVFQSKKSLEDLHPSLSFKKEQNTLTETIINKYLSKCVNFDEIEREMIQLMQSTNVEIIIVRVAIKAMGLAVDFISVKEEVRDKGVASFEIEYDGEEVLCDKMYRRKSQMIHVDKAQIYQVYLSKKVSIKNCSKGKFVFKQIHF